MFNPRFKSALVALAASAALGACTSYGPYGGTSVGVGVGYGSPYGYGYGYGSPYGYGYGSPYYAGYPYYGWYDGFYYPGAGYWMYDGWGHHYPITKKHSDYWSNMLERARKNDTNFAKAQVQENWSGFTAGAKAPTTTEQRRSLDTIRQRISAQAKAERSVAQPRSIEQRQLRVERQRQQTSERQQVRAERQQQVRSEGGQSIRQIMIERRQSRGKSGDE